VSLAVAPDPEFGNQVYVNLAERNGKVGTGGSGRVSRAVMAGVSFG
jgi:hypothetical protein